MFMFSKRGRLLVQLSYLYRPSCSLSSKAIKDFGFVNEATPSSSVECKRGGGNVSSSFHPFSLLSDRRDNVKDYNIELVDDQTWGVSTGLADAWRGDRKVNGLRNDVVDEFDAYVPSNDSEPDLDEIEDMRIRGTLFYKLDKDSKEYEEYNHEFLKKKSSKNKAGQDETKEDKKSRNSDPIADRSFKNKNGQKESKMKENLTGFSVGNAKLHNFNENYHLTSSVDQIHGFRDEKRSRTPTFNQLTAAYHEPFCLDIYISKASVRACIVHRATSKVVAVAHSISKDMKFDLGSTRNATACAAVGKVLAQRALADDIHNAVYTPRRGEKLEAVILPVVQKQHQLLVTLLLCNAAAMEALPLYLDKIFDEVVAILLSVTFVLFFGEVIPQAICSRYGLAVGANFIWLVRFLMIICYPVSYPIGKILDWVLGHNEALFRRAQLKALVSIHSKEEGKGGELTHDETTIISGALDLTEKTAEEAMTPIESTFSLDVNSKLDWEAMGKILGKGHSRVPVYSGNPNNIIGLLLVKSLLTVRAETETPVSAISIRRIPRVPADMPLYDILNEFQKGSSHMAAVVKSKRCMKSPSLGEVQNMDGTDTEVISQSSSLLSKHDKKLESVVVNIENIAAKPANSNMQTAGNSISSEDTEDREVIGIITLEDVFEELLQEEIVDETDVYVDVHKRIRVAAAAAAASSIARIPSIRKLTALKGAGSQSKKRLTIKLNEDDPNSTGVQGSLAEPLLGKKQ